MAPLPTILNRRSAVESDRIGIHIVGFAKVVGDLIAGLRES
jgi:hypothetical protein